MSALFGISKHYFNFFARNSGVPALMGPWTLSTLPTPLLRHWSWAGLGARVLHDGQAPCLSVCLCLLVTIMKHAKMDKRVDIPFRMWTYGGHWTIGVHICATWRTRWMIRARWRCGLISNYFDHLFFSVHIRNRTPQHPCMLYSFLLSYIIRTEWRCMTETKSASITSFTPLNLVSWFASVNHTTQGCAFRTQTHPHLSAGLSSLSGDEHDPPGLFFDRTRAWHQL